MLSLKEQQERLSLNLINYDLEKMWSSHPLIAELRESVKKLMPPDKAYDPQDLEHQVLFRLTTFDPKDINNETIKSVIDEQFGIVKYRLSKLDFDIEYLFRGLTGKYQDLNINDRLELCWEDDKIIAKNDRRSFSVEFRTIDDERLISLFSNELHYIHQDRPRGETFSFFFTGDEVPWAIETTEPSVIAKQYKRDALLANGIDPNKAVELTRFYTLPGAPTNAISLMDGLVAKYYKSKGIEALFTTTMPMYAKTKSTTIAGGINKPLLVKDLRHKFIPVEINGRTLYRHVTTVPEDNKEIKILETHPNFPTMLVVEVFRTINETNLKPLPMLEDGGKVIYVSKRERSKTEEEIKLFVSNIATALEKIRRVGKYVRTEYIRDTIYGESGKDKKIRLRIEDNFEYVAVNATIKTRDSVQNGIKREIEETVYKGPSAEEAISTIKMLGDFKEENSYEKIRVIFIAETAEITVDIYPFGCWIEIEDEPEKIHRIAQTIGFSKKDYVSAGADDLYLEWIKSHGLPEQWDVRFGLEDKK